MNVLPADPRRLEGRTGRLVHEARRAGIEVIPLADHRRHLGTVAEWLHTAWFAESGESLADVTARLARRRADDALAAPLLAPWGGHPAGTARLVLEPQPLDGVPLPCLADRFVVPAWRGRGIGTTLCDAALREAHRRGIGVLSLFAVDAEASYRRRGWRPVGTFAVPIDRSDTLATPMRRDTAGHAKPRDGGRAAARRAVEAA